MKTIITFRPSTKIASFAAFLCTTILAFAQTASPSSGNSDATRSKAKDIVDLLSEKKIQVQTEGSGIQNVNVRIKRRGTAPITVSIPVGTFFVSGNQSSQNMVTTEASEVTLDGDDWQSVSLSTACANRPKHIPEKGDRFGIQRSPNQKELAVLMPALEKADVDYKTRQAAVWIVTDNADYDDLGILMGSRNGGANYRVINEEEAARAMKVCGEAGINIKSKAIWENRKKILRGLKDEELKKWLQQKQ